MWGGSANPVLDGAALDVVDGTDEGVPEGTLGVDAAELATGELELTPGAGVEVEAAGTVVAPGVTALGLALGAGPDGDGAGLTAVGTTPVVVVLEGWVLTPPGFSPPSSGSALQLATPSESTRPSN